jgi:hypothetical protein
LLLLANFGLSFFLKGLSSFLNGLASLLKGLESLLKGFPSPRGSAALGPPGPAALEVFFRGLPFAQSSP